MAIETINAPKPTRPLPRPKKSVSIKKGGDMSRMVKKAY